MQPSSRSQKKPDHPRKSFPSRRKIFLAKTQSTQRLGFTAKDTKSTERNRRGRSRDTGDMGICFLDRCQTAAGRRQLLKTSEKVKAKTHESVDRYFSAFTFSDVFSRQRSRKQHLQVGFLSPHLLYLPISFLTPPCTPCPLW